MTNYSHFPQPDLLSGISNDQTIAAIDKEFQNMKQKIQYAANNPELIDDRRELCSCMNELYCILVVINRGLPPLPQEIKIFDRSY